MMVSTADRSDTREGADTFINEQLEKLLDQEYLDIEGGTAFFLNEANAPAKRFDVLAATGYGKALSHYTKPSNEFEQVEATKSNPVKLQEEWIELCDEIETLQAKLAEAIQRKTKIIRIATLSGIALPE